MEETSTPPDPPFLQRVVKVFFSPGELFLWLRKKPVWGMALVLGGLLLGLSLALIPSDVWVEFSRAQMAARGQDVPGGFGGSGTLFRIFSIVGGLAGWFIWAFILAGILTFGFAFVLGDEGRYAQYLSVVAHALLISAVGAVVTAPLKIAQADPTLTLNLGTFLPLLEDGFLFRFLRLLDLFALWGYGVMAVGVTKIDPRRGLGSAMAVLYGFAVVVALAFAPFGP